MIIDSLTDRSDIDISSLAISEPAKRREVWFDPEKDLLAEDFNRAMLALGSARTKVYVRGDSYVGEWALLAVPMEYLYSEKAHKLGVDEVMQKNLFARIDQVGPSGVNPEPDVFLALAAYAKVLYPGKLSKTYFNDDAFQYVCDGVTGKVGSTRSLLRLQDRMLDAMILFPERRKELLRLTGNPFIGLGDYLVVWREQFQWSSLAGSLAKLKLLMPEEMIEVTREDWECLKKRLKEYRAFQNTQSFNFFALDLLVLAAEEARIGEEGLIINLRKQDSLETTDKIPEMPVKRAF